MAKNKKSVSKIELEQQKKKEANESIEYLRQVELPESQGGGPKFVEDTIKQEEKETKDEKDTLKTYLEEDRKRTFTYTRQLAMYGYEQLEQLQISDKRGEWEYYCIPTVGGPINIFGKQYETQEGVLVILRSPTNAVYIRGIKVTRNPEFDVKAMDILVVQAENTVDSEKGLLLSDNKDTESTLKKTEGGLYVPKR